MTNFALQLISSAAVSALLTGALIWLTKSVIAERLKNAIKSEYDEKLETHKAQLKAKSDVESERLRAELSIAATEHQVRFLRLHEERALVIAKLYKLFAKVQWECTRYVGPREWMVEEPLDVRLSGIDRLQSRKATFEAMVSCYRYLDSHRIYLPYGTGQTLDNLIRQIWVRVEQTSAYVRGAEIPSLNINYQEAYESQKDTLEYINNQFLQARRALEVDLRHILGDS